MEEFDRIPAGSIVSWYGTEYEVVEHISKDRLVVKYGKVELILWWREGQPGQRIVSVK